MKKLLHLVFVIALLSAASSASAADGYSRGECSAAVSLPPACVQRIVTPAASTGGLPVSSLPVSEPVSMDFFDNSAVFGHSHTVGMQMNLPLVNTDFYSVTGITAPGFLYYKDFRLPVIGYGSYRKALAQKTYDCIYIMLGTNDMPARERGVAVYEDAMRQLLTETLAAAPDTRIYLLSLAPIAKHYLYSPETEEIAASIILYSQSLKSISREFDLPYIDIHRAMSGADGYALPAISVKDGLHFTKEGYEIILDLMRTHT